MEHSCNVCNVVDTVPFIHTHSIFKPWKSKKQYNIGTDILDDKVVVNFVYQEAEKDDKDEKSSLKEEMEGNEYTPV